MGPDSEGLRSHSFCLLMPNKSHFHYYDVHSVYPPAPDGPTGVLDRDLPGLKHYSRSASCRKHKTCLRTLLRAFSWYKMLYSILWMYFKYRYEYIYIYVCVCVSIHHNHHYHQLCITYTRVAIIIQIPFLHSPRLIMISHWCKWMIQYF